jgi:SAM-dependent methyltransferase
LVQARADALPFRAGVFDVIGLLAVIEHVEDDGRALREAQRVARPGAILLLLTSAFMVLWSHHDVANNHCRRYRLRQLQDSLRAAGWTPLRLSYINALIFPVVLITRLIQRVLQPPETASYDMGPDMGLFNHLLEAALVAEGTLVTRLRWRLPFGVDLLGIACCDD